MAQMLIVCDQEACTIFKFQNTCENQPKKNYKINNKLEILNA